MIRFVSSLLLAGFMLEGARQMDVQMIADQMIAETFNEYALEQPDPDAMLTESERASLSRYLDVPQVAEVYPGIGRALENQSVQ
jgi:hypothetical protein